MDYNESHERKLYEMLKKQITVERGLAKLLPLDNQGFDDLNSIISDDLDRLGSEILKLLVAKIPYAIFDYLENELIFTFKGKFFIQEECLTTNKILRYDVIDSRETIAEEIRKDLEKLKRTLRNTQGA